MLPFSGVWGRGQTPSKHKNTRAKVQNDICTSTHIYNRISQILNLTPLYSVLLASLAHQLNCNWFMHTEVRINWINLSPIFKTWFGYKYSAYQLLLPHNGLNKILLECVFSQNIIIFIYWNGFTLISCWLNIFSSAIYLLTSLFLKSSLFLSVFLLIQNLLCCK